MDAREFLAKQSWGMRGGGHGVSWTHGCTGGAPWEYLLGSLLRRAGEGRDGKSQAAGCCALTPPPPPPKKKKTLFSHSSQPGDGTSLSSKSC